MALPSGYNTSYKPSSVRVKRSMTIYLRRLLPNGLGISPAATQGDMSGKRSLYGVASDRVYICTQLPVVPVSSYLAFPSLPLSWRSISVALSLRSPSADVIRYPAL